MFAKRRLSIVFLLSLLLLGESLNVEMALARFGGAGVGRGNFGRGDFDHGDAWGDHAGGPFGNIDRSYYGDDHAYDPGAVQRPLATDGGLGRFAGYGAHPVMGAHPAVNGDAVRHAYCDRHCFDRDWWAAHHYGYYYPWMNSGYCWGYTSWPMMAGFWGMAAASSPVAYDYGNNITYQGNNVYYGSSAVATAPQYAEQADNLATLAPVISLPAEPTSGITTGTELPKLKPENEKDWKPLGVFSLVQGGQTDSSKLFQLMVNKEGHIHGNYYDMMTDEVKPISGAVDKKSMRAAWKVSGVKDVTYDTGVSNLLKQDSPILIHFGKDRTEQWNLVRLEQPNKSKDPAVKSTIEPAEKTSSQLDKTSIPTDSTI